jgi:redox-sensitive bicupin YhaK (pirin superfamily)
MLVIRPAGERGHADHGWLETWHTFSFASYQDPRHMRFRTLRVMNEDTVAPGQGFGTHPHNDMEIVTYVLSGVLEHRDSMGNGEQLRPGEFQRMTAGTGITHSEFNPSLTDPVHLYQIWLTPDRKGLPPSYEQKAFSAVGRENQWRLVASSSGKEGSLTIHTDAAIYLSQLSTGSSVSYEPAATRHLWLQVLRGQVMANQMQLGASDGLAISQEDSLEITAFENSELLLFDLP